MLILALMVDVHRRSHHQRSTGPPGPLTGRYHSAGIWEAYWRGVLQHVSGSCIGVLQSGDDFRGVMHNAKTAGMHPP